jgi:hypothetical protein
MSDDAHAIHGAGAGNPPLPASAGIAIGVRILVVGGVVLAIMQGSFVVGSSAFGRVWPAAASAKIELPPMNLKGTS